MMFVVSYWILKTISRECQASIIITYFSYYHYLIRPLWQDQQSFYGSETFIALQGYTISAIVISDLYQVLHTVAWPLTWFCRPGQPAAASGLSVFVLLPVALLRGPGHSVHPPVCGLLSSGVRHQHWALLRPALWGCQEGLLWATLSGILN